MRRSLRRVLLAVTVAVAGLLPFAAPVAAANPCGSVTSDKIIIVKHMGDTIYPGSYFDRSESTALITQLDPCEGFHTSGPYGSYILGANLQGDTYIVQLGYGRVSDTDYLDFWYTPAQNGVAVRWPGSFGPVSGERYKFEVYKYDDPVSLTQKARFRITRLSTGAVQTALSTNPWAGSYWLNWWGAETIDTGSRLGGQVNGVGNDLVNMTDMGYSQTATSSTIWRDGITNDYWGASGCPSGSYQYIHKNCIWREGSVSSNEHGHVYTDDTTGDSINIEDHGGS